MRLSPATNSSHPSAHLRRPSRSTTPALTAGPALRAATKKKATKKKATKKKGAPPPPTSAATVSPCGQLTRLRTRTAAPKKKATKKKATKKKATKKKGTPTTTTLRNNSRQRWLLPAPPTAGRQPPAARLHPQR